MPDIIFKVFEMLEINTTIYIRITGTTLVSGQAYTINK